MENVTLEPGRRSTEFTGKVILQIIIITNLFLNLFKLPSLDVSPEISLGIAGGIEAVWMIFRQWNKRLELSTQTAVAIAEKSIKMEGVKAAVKIREMQTEHAHKMEQMKLSKEPSHLEKSMQELGKAFIDSEKDKRKGKKGSEPNAKS
jgi:hypothetical protein